ncbi:MAG: protein-glutamate O-methyltransferase [Phycisphaerae bacterium]|nr:protein-glutamate O-methyltransferase [Phycisphaerae bacterium]
MLVGDNITIKESDFRRISDVIYKHCGINLHEGKKTLVRARLAKRIRELNFNDVTSYIDFALHQDNIHEFYNLVDSISTNLTSFFREKVHFDYIRQTFLPQLLQQKKTQGNNQIRIWSAGCSSGEEPYTIAITMAEELAGKGSWDLKILASDVSTRILKTAQAGIYDSSKIKPLSTQQRLKYMTNIKVDGQITHQVRPELKSKISFRYLNLMESWPFKGPFDIIMCRNVMIYFDKPTQTKLVNRYYDCQAKGGLLCIGHSESLTNTNHKYKYVMPATYMK